MRSGDRTMKNCLIEPVFTKEVTTKLLKFGMVQLELSQALAGAKPLGICKITTYVDPKFAFKSLDLTYVNGKSSTRTVTILTKDDLREML